MTDLRDVFSTEYQAGTVTDAPVVTRVMDVPIEVKLEQEMKTAAASYGDGKPHRIVVRARIIND